MRNKIRLKIQRHVISASRIIVEHTTEGVSVSDVASMAAEAMVANITVHAVENVVRIVLYDSPESIDYIFFRYRISTDASSNTSIQLTAIKVIYN